MTVALGIVIPTIVVTDSSTTAGLPDDALDDPDGGLAGGFAGGCVVVGGGVCGLGGEVCCDGGGVCGLGGGAV